MVSSRGTLAGADDATLVDRAKSGDRSAMDSLLRRHYDRISSVCRRITGNEADANDATQEALLAIVRGLSRFDGTSAFSTWAYRVATNASLDELRRRKRRPTPTLLVDHGGGTRRSGGGASGGGNSGGGGGSGEDAGVVVADHSTPLDDAVALSIDIDQALSSLPMDYRAAVVLRDLCGLDYAEIGEILSIPGGTVRSRIARGRAALAPLVAGNQEANTQRRTSTSPPTSTTDA